MCRQAPPLNNAPDGGGWGGWGGGLICAIFLYSANGSFGTDPDLPTLISTMPTGISVKVLRPLCQGCRSRVQRRHPRAIHSKLHCGPRQTANHGKLAVTVTKKKLNRSGPKLKVILLSNQIPSRRRLYDDADPRSLSTHRSARVLNLRRDLRRGENASVIIGGY